MSAGFSCSFSSFSMTLSSALSLVWARAGATNPPTKEEKKVGAREYLDSIYKTFFETTDTSKSSFACNLSKQIPLPHYDTAI